MTNDPVFVLQMRTSTDVFYLLSDGKGKLRFARLYVPFSYPNQGFRLYTCIGTNKVKEFLDHHPGLCKPNIKVCHMIFSGDGQTITFQEFNDKTITRA